MKINHEALSGGILGNFVTGLGLVSLQDVESIVGIICLVVGCLITITSGVIIPLIKWWKNAKADGKITAEELEELQKELESAKKTIEDLTNKEETNK